MKSKELRKFQSSASDSKCTSSAGSQGVHDDITVQGSSESIVINTPQLHCGALALCCPNEVQPHINAGKIGTRAVCVCVCVCTVVCGCVHVLCMIVCVLFKERDETDVSTTFDAATHQAGFFTTFNHAPLS